MRTQFSINEKNSIKNGLIDHRYQSKWFWKIIDINPGLFGALVLATLLIGILSAIHVPGNYQLLVSILIAFTPILVFIVVKYDWKYILFYIIIWAVSRSFIYFIFDQEAAAILAGVLLLVPLTLIVSHLIIARKKIIVTATVKVYALFCFMALSITLLSLNYTSLNDLSKLITGLFLMFVLQNYINSNESIVKVLNALVIAGLLGSLITLTFFILNKIGINFSSYGRVAESVYRASGPMGDIYVTAAFLFICFFCSLFLVENNELMGWGKTFYTISSLVILLAIISTLTRAVILGMAMYYFYWLFSSNKKNKVDHVIKNLLLLLLIFCVTLIFFSPEDISSRASDLPFFGTAENIGDLGSNRITIWTSYLNVIRRADIISKTFGFGLGEQLYRKPHNSFLFVFYQMGLTGFMIYILFILTTINVLRKPSSYSLFYNDFQRHVLIMFISYLLTLDMFTDNYNNSIERWLLLIVIAVSTLSEVKKPDDFSTDAYQTVYVEGD